MIRIATLALALAALAVAPHPARAGQNRVSLNASGEGVFAPANIGVGTPGTAFILGDGSGLSAYQAAGEDFRIDGEQLGHNTHTGAVQTRTAGVLDPETMTVHWPCASASNPYLEQGNRKVHIMSTAAGDIHLTYRARGTEFVMDLATGAVKGYGDFKVVGGTGAFRGAKGHVDVEVTAIGMSAEGGIEFAYVFEGYLDLPPRP